MKTLYPCTLYVNLNYVPPNVTEVSDEDGRIRFLRLNILGGYLFFRLGQKSVLTLLFAIIGLPNN